MTHCLGFESNQESSDLLEGGVAGKLLLTQDYEKPPNKYHDEVHIFHYFNTRTITRWPTFTAVATPTTSTTSVSLEVTIAGQSCIIVDQSNPYVIQLLLSSLKGKIKSVPNRGIGVFTQNCVQLYIQPLFHD